MTLSLQAVSLLHACQPPLSFRTARGFCYSSFKSSLPLSRSRSAYLSLDFRGLFTSLRSPLAACFLDYLPSRPHGYRRPKGRQSNRSLCHLFLIISPALRSLVRVSPYPLHLRGTAVVCPLQSRACCLSVCLSLSVCRHYIYIYQSVLISHSVSGTDFIYIVHYRISAYLCIIK